MSGDEAAALAAGLVDLGFEDAASLEAPLHAFIRELVRWNRAFNLVSAGAADALVPAHVLDSLSIVPYLRARLSPRALAAPPPGGERLVLDLGTGAGLPGIPLAIAMPDVRFVLLDANGKRVRFCRHVETTLGLANVEVVQARAEGYEAPRPFDAVVVRAVGSLARLRGLAGRHCAGPVLAMKGRYPAAELAEIDARTATVERLRVPGLDAERHLVIM